MNRSRITNRVSEDTLFPLFAKSASRGASVLVTLIGCIVFLGWLFDISALKSILPMWVTMKANTAIGFIFSGFALWHLTQFNRRVARRAQLLGAIALGIGLLTLVQYGLGVDLGIDQLLFQESVGAVATSMPGRMAANTAFNFVLLGSALVLLSRPRSFQPGVQTLTLIALFISLLGLLGYLYNIQEFYGFGSYTRMAVHTAIAFIVLCVGMLCLHPQQGVMETMTSHHAGGMMARRLLPMALGVPPILSGIILAGYRAQLYSGEVGLSLSAVFSILAFAVIIWRNAKVLGRIDTRRQQAEDQRRSEERFRSLTTATSQIVWSTRADGQVVEDSPSWRAYTGQTYEDYQGLGWLNAIHPADREESAQRWLQAVATQGVYEAEYRLQSADKTYRYCMVRGVPVLAQDGSVDEWLGTCTDIHDRKQTEVALKQSEERFRSLMQASAQIIWNTNAEGELVVEQPGWRAFTGQAFEEYKGWGWLSTIHPDDSAHVASVWSQAVASRSLYQVEFRMRRHDGVYRYMSCRAVPIMETDGTIREWIGANTDITETKQAEAALAESEAKFRYLVENATDLIWSSTLDGTLTYLSPCFQQMTGYTASEFLHRSFVPLVHGDDLPGYQAFLKRVEETGEQQNGFEFRFNRQDGSWFWVSSNASPVKNDLGAVVGFQGIIHDISDRKQAETELKEREEQLRQFVEHAPISVIMLDRDMRYLVVSHQWLQEFNLQAQQVLGRSHYEVFPEVSDEWKQIHQRCLGGVVEKCEEDPFPRADGSLDWVRWAIHPWYNAQGKVGGIILFSEVITERKQAEQKLRQTLDMLDLASDSIIIRDMSDRIVYWNQGAEKLYGWKREEVLGQYIHTFLQTVFPESLETSLAEFFQTGQWEGELHHTTRKGRSIIVASRWTLQRDAAGNPFAQLEINSDITQRKTAEIALRQSEERLQAILDNSPAVFYMKDPQGRLLSVNRQFESLFHIQRADLIGQRNVDLFSQELANIFDANERAVLEAKAPMQWEEVVPHEDGLHTYLSLKFPLLTPEREPYAVCGISTDITERKQAEVALEQAKEAAEAANRAKSEFLANMSHELRTPLNGVIGYAQILQRAKTLNEEDRSRIEVIHQCGTHLLTLINDILDLSKIEARKTELLPTDFHLPAFLQGVAEMCRIRAELKGIEFRYESAPELPMGIRADEKRLRQVLINLLSNAIKFTDAGCVTFTVHFASEEKIRFVVRDTGIGIPQEKLQAIFQPFEQVSDAKRQFEGTGLGLAISQEIVELMGSTIQVQSDVGVGSIFWFDVELPEAEEWVKAAQSDRHGQIIGIQDRQPKILVVDDKWENRSVVANLLNPIGFEVAEAVDGTDGWQKIQEFRPDLVITDLLMPSTDGFELIHQIRASEEFNHVIVIVSSASVFESDQYRSIEAGGNDFLPKPVLATELLEKLQKHLNLHWIYEEQQRSLTPEMDSGKLIAPPAAELDMLYELAMKGSFKGILKQVVLIEQLDQKYVPFAKRLHQLAKGFQDQEILALIQSHR